MVKEKINGTHILGIILLLGAIINFMKTFVFPLTLITTPLLLIAVVIYIFIDKEDAFSKESISFYLGFVFAISLVLLFLSYLIGFGLGGTTFGQACTDTYFTIAGAEQLVIENLDNATNLFIDETCNIVDIISCNILKSSAEAGKNLHELQNIAFKFNKIK